MGNLKQIDNPGQAFSLGASWGTPSVDNTMTTEICNLINNTALTLYTGDIVCMDATGTMVNQPTTATLSMAIGCVGSAAEFGAYPAVENIAGSNVSNTFPTIAGSMGGTGISALTTDGSAQPFSLAAWSAQSVGFTNGSANMTSSSSASVNPLAVGLYVVTPYNASTNATPQIFQVVSNGGSAGSWTAVGVVIAGGGTTFSGTTGTFTTQVGRDAESRGPGWAAPAGWTNTSAFAPGVVVPVVTKGFGRVNVNGLTTTAAGDFILGTNGSFVGTRVAQGSATAAQIGLFIAVPLEAYAQRDTTLGTSLGFTGHDSVRAIIGKF